MRKIISIAFQVLMPSLLPALYMNEAFAFEDATSNQAAPESGAWCDASEIGAPFLSLLLPGFDQYCQRDYRSGALFTSLGATGLAVAQKHRFIGLQTYMTAGSFSLFLGFEAARKTRPDRYIFIEPLKRETVEELALAPFRFSHLAEPEVFLPLGVLLGALAYEHHNPPKGFVRDHFSHDDLYRTGVMSYQAGVSEEIMFRGWMMPLLQERGELSPFAANMVQSSFFALAHSPNQSLPLTQFLLGAYSGYLTQRDGHSLSKSVFLHTWWDVIAFAAIFTLRKDDANATSEQKLNLITLVF